MRTVTISLLALLVVPAALSGSTRNVTAPAPVTALAFDGSRIAYASGRSAHDCNRIHVWNLSTRGVSRFPRPTSCVRTSTGSGISGLALAGSRVLWVHYIGGNTREWTLWTATASRTTPRRLRYVARDVDAPAPIVLGGGDSSRAGDMLPYAVDDEVVALRANGARRFSWTAPARVVALWAYGGELAVATEGGLVTVLDASGDVLRTETYASEVQAVRPTGSALLVQRGRTLELRGGGPPRTWSLPARARLGDAQGNRAWYVAGAQIVELRLDAANRRRALALGSHVAAEGARVSTANGRRVTLRPL